MLSDVGDIANFGPEMLPNDYLKKIDNANMVSFFNWTSNHKGTELVDKVFTAASKNKIPTYFAPADYTERIHEIPMLFDNLGTKLKILSINENETRI